MFLQAVAGEPVVGKSHGQGKVGLGIRPSQLAKKLTNVGWRAIAPAIFAETVAGGEPVQALVIAAAVLKFYRPPIVGTVVGLAGGAGAGTAVSGLD